MRSQRWKLCVMMFLEFFIWGAWFPLIFGYLPSLGFNAEQQSWILVTFNVAAITALFFSAQYADRHFAAEKFLAFSQFVGGLAMMGLFFVKSGWTVPLFGAEIDLSFVAFFLLLLLHSLFYVPTISITNSIAFAHLREPQREFGLVRVWGTIGWIAAAWPMTFFLIDWARVPEFGTLPIFEWLGRALGTSRTGADFRLYTSYTFIVAGAASLVLALFSLVLPHTPPKPAEQAGEKLAWLEAMRFLAKPFVLVLFIVTFLDAAVHQFYFVWVERYLTNPQGVHILPNWAMPVISISQVAEILTMAFLGYVLKSLGWRFTMVIGILGHAARFLVFALFPEPWIAASINVLHGICYAFFFATVYIFVDEFFPKDVRSSAQGLFNLLILGLGPMVANFAAPWLGERFKDPSGAINFHDLFLVPAGVALGAAVFLLLFFHPPTRAETMSEIVEAPPLQEV
jgi:MFS family permease